MPHDPLMTCHNWCIQWHHITLVGKSMYKSFSLTIANGSFTSLEVATGSGDGYLMVLLEHGILTRADTKLDICVLPCILIIKLSCKNYIIIGITRVVFWMKLFHLKRSFPDWGGVGWFDQIYGLLLDSKRELTVNSLRPSDWSPHRWPCDCIVINLDNRLPPVRHRAIT